MAVFHYFLQNKKHKYLERDGSLLQTAGGKDVVPRSVAQSTPGHNVNDGESSGVIGIGDERHLLSETVTSLEMGLSVLRGQACLGKLLALVGEDDEAAKSQSTNGGPADNEVGVGEGLGHHAGASHRLSGRGPLDLRSSYGNWRKSQDFEIYLDKLGSKSR